MITVWQQGLAEALHEARKQAASGVTHANRTRLRLGDFLFYLSGSEEESCLFDRIVAYERVS